MVRPFKRLTSVYELQLDRALIFKCCLSLSFFFFLSSRLSSIDTIPSLHMYLKYVNVTEGQKGIHLRPLAIKLTPGVSDASWTRRRNGGDSASTSHFCYEAIHREIPSSRSLALLAQDKGRLRMFFGSTPSSGGASLRQSEDTYPTS